MIRKTQISIPTPCHENWDNMAIAEKGRFCDSCKKTVIDFTKLSDREILEKLGTDKNLCGRFLDSQLNRELMIPKEKSSIWIAGATGILTLFNVGNSSVYSQENHKTEQTQTEKKSIPVSGKITSPEIEVSGTVSDDAGILPGANIVIKGIDKIVYADIDGNFNIKAHENDTLIISFIGLISKEIVVRNTENIQIVLEKDPLFDIEVTMVGGISRRRTLPGRVMLFIGNLFRSKENIHY